MDPLRVALFLGLVFHKALWEVLKRGEGGAGRQESAPVPRGLGAVKLLKVLMLTFLLVQTLFLDVLPIADEPRALRVAGAIVFFFGLATAVAGRLRLGRSWVDLEDYRVLPRQALVTTGIYRYVRHPIYAGDLLLLVGLELALNSWLVLGVALPVVVVVRQVMAEEGILARAFPSYRDYSTRTKRFIPFVV